MKSRLEESATARVTESHARVSVAERRGGSEGSICMAIVQSAKESGVACQPYKLRLYASCPAVRTPQTETRSQFQAHCSSEHALTRFLRIFCSKYIYKSCAL